MTRNGSNIFGISLGDIGAQVKEQAKSVVAGKISDVISAIPDSVSGVLKSVLGSGSLGGLLSFLPEQFAAFWQSLPWSDGREVTGQELLDFVTSQVGTDET